jgi:HEAT repeats
VKRRIDMQTDPLSGDLVFKERRYACGVLNPLRCIALFILCGQIAFAAGRVGDIEFFGYKGLDLEKIREALPIRKGDAFTDQTKAQIREAVTDQLGKEPTDVAAVCCDESGDRLLFIGLPGESSEGFAYNPVPAGDARLPAAIHKLSDRLDQAIEAAVKLGGQNAQEDDANGYALTKEPKARALELDLRAWALPHEGELFEVLRSSADVDDRRIASEALGYGQESDAQIAALTHAARDPDDEVRNNATRALGVLARSNPALAAKIDPETFIAMLNSGTWTDRNKGAALVMQLTAARNPELLAKIRASALDSLVEMASWKRPSHAYFARMILGRVGGLPKDKLAKLAWDGPPNAIPDAVRKQ